MTALVKLVTQSVMFLLNVSDIQVIVIHQHDGVTTFTCQGLLARECVMWTVYFLRAVDWEVAPQWQDWFWVWQLSFRPHISHIPQHVVSWADLQTAVWFGRNSTSLNSWRQETNHLWIITMASHLNIQETYFVLPYVTAGWLHN